MYEFSLPGGEKIALSDVVEVLGIVDGTNNGRNGDENSAETAENDAENAIDDVVEETGINSDTNTALTLGDVAVSDATREFVADVASVEFSSPELVDVSKTDADTTVGQIKESRGLECQYSAELTEEQIAEINNSTVEAGDWALISMLPFDTEESLTVTMKNGDQFVVKVTDAQQVTHSATFKTGERFVIAYVDSEGKYNVLMSDGSYEQFDTAEDIDFLDSRYLWQFYYVFTEKDQTAPNANYEYYFVRPIEDLTKSIALIDVNDTDLVQTGANNIAVIPQGDGTFVMEGYSSVGADMPCLYFNGTEFVLDMTNKTPLTIFTQDDIKKYQFTVRTADPTMGLVYGKDKDGVEQNGVEQFVTRTKDSHNNNWGAQAKPFNENAGGQYRYVFDYFDLNGVVVPADKVTFTDSEGRNAKISADNLEIPYNGSILTAHFKQNPEYVGASKVDSLKDWVDEIKSTNVPLDEEATKKTAEVYDYENRIYRVDLTTRSSLNSFTGTVDLGFILDVSGSMKFPSKLELAKKANDASTEIGSHDIKTINEASEKHTEYLYRGQWIRKYVRGAETREVVDRYNWQDWGLSPNETYYVIADKSTKATVFKLFHDDDGWHRVDASKDSNYDSSQRLIDSNTVFGEDTDFNYPIYVSTDNNADDTPVTRSYYEKKSIDETAKTINEVLGILNIAEDSSESPNVRAAWNTYAFEVKDKHHSFVDLKDSDSLSINYATAGGTRTDLAFEDAKSFEWGSSNTKYVILITDGAPQFGSTNNDSDPYNTSDHSVVQKTEELNNRIKAKKQWYEDQGIKVITVGLSVKDVPQATQLLYDIADTVNGKHMFFQAESGDELENALLEIVKTILLPCNVYGEVTDTVSDGFYLVDRETGKPLQPGDKITLGGVLTNDTSQAYGVVEQDGRTVKWQNQEFTPEGWQGTVYVKAKEDLLGGNMLPTNSGNAVFTAKEYSTRTNPDHKITITTNTEQIVNPEKFKPILERETPLVNVNELSFLQNSTEWTVYLGTEVDPKQQMEKLWHEILVEEVVKEGCADDKDNDGLPEVGKNQAGNLWYPLKENSIVDDRESEGSGDKETFTMNDLIKVLAEGEDYSWWDYTKNEPKWSEFFTQALNGGITIPYHVYGIDDGSNIVITLTKTIVTGEEDGITGNSPHVTTVTGDKVEQYTLKVLYSPDYTVLPRGQGGSRTEDIHTGTYGTLYQGHAAGTETSTNTHLINVFAKKLQVLKTDQSKNTITDDTATFVLYRKATANDTSVETTTLSGVSGSFVAVQTLTTSGGAVTTDALPLLANDEPYYLVETKAPAGYIMLTEPLKVTIDMDGHNTWTKLADSSASQEKPNPYVLSNWLQEATIKLWNLDNTSYDPSQTLTYDHTNDTTDASVTYKIINNAGYELPSTGGSGTLPYTLGGLMLVIASALMYGFRIRRRERKLN